MHYILTDEVRGRENSRRVLRTTPVLDDTMSDTVAVHRIVYIYHKTDGKITFCTVLLQCNNIILASSNEKKKIVSPAKLYYGY